MVDTLLAQKKDMRQVWTTDGRRLVVTRLSLAGNVVARQISGEGEPTRVQIAFGDKKLHNMNRAQRVPLENAGVSVGKRVFKEANASEAVAAGTALRVEDVFQPGSIIKLTGRSKGMGFAGVVKRHGFAGGPKTHGQSDRQRAPGSIGAGTTPGRVFAGKKMPGRGGNLTITLEQLPIVAVDSVAQCVWVKGTVPGAYNSFLTLHKQDGNVSVSLNEHSQTVLGLTQAEPVVAETTEETQA